LLGDDFEFAFDQLADAPVGDEPLENPVQPYPPQCWRSPEERRQPGAEDRVVAASEHRLGLGQYAVTDLRLDLLLDDIDRGLKDAPPPLESVRRTAKPSLALVKNGSHSKP
jgi:hypothetical protein